MLGIDMIQYKNSLTLVQFLKSLNLTIEEHCKERPNKVFEPMTHVGMFDDVRMWVCPFLFLKINCFDFYYFWRML